MPSSPYLYILTKLYEVIKYVINAQLGTNGRRLQGGNGEEHGGEEQPGRLY